MRLLSVASGRAVAILAAVLLIGPGRGPDAGAQGMIDILSGGIVATTDVDRVIGCLEWEIREEGVTGILAHGEGPVHLKDVVIYDRSTQTVRITPKYIRLNQRFMLKMSEFPAPTPNGPVGFGIAAHRSGLASSFSWEWFNLRGRERAVKLQEGGELGIRIQQVGSDWEITRTDFITDISLRAFPVDVEPPGDVKWRIRISRGSSITWPSVVKGKIIPN